jgi:hypothetical protein
LLIFGAECSLNQKNTVEINLLRWFVTAAIPWDAKIFNMLCLSFKVPHRKLLSGKSLEDEYDLVKGYIDPKL